MNASISRWAKRAQNYGLFIAGIFLGVSIFMIATVQLSILAMEQGASEGMPHMHPSIQYFFVPVVASAVAVPAVLLNIVINLFHKRSFSPMAWLALGFGYSCILSFLPFGHFLQAPLISVPAAFILSASVIAYTRIAYGVRVEAKNA